MPANNNNNSLSIKAGKLKYKAFDPGQPRVRIYGNTAVLTGTATVQVESATIGPAPFQILFTDVYVRDVIATVESELPRLQAIDEERASAPRAPGKWSPKQVIGHLVDSAVNNQQRFVRAQLGPSLAFPGYAQVEWVAAQAYQERSWADLLLLWTVINRHLAHVIAHIEPRALGTPCTIGQGVPVTLRFVAEDYVRHLHHHLAQVLPQAAAGKTHLPYA